MRRRRSSVTFALLVVTGAFLGALAGAGVGVGGAQTVGGDVPFQTGDVDPDAVVLRAAVDADGDAAWTVEYRIRLDDANTTAAFESLARDVRANESEYSDRFARRMGRTVGAAENATGREMSVANVSVSARRQSFGQDFGVVSYRFEWKGFAAVDGERLVVGDALSGFFLDSETRLVVAWPESYDSRSVEPEPTEVRDSAVVWVGPTDFAPGEPRVVVAPPGVLPSSPFVVGGAVALVVGGAVLAWRFRDGDGVGIDVGGSTDGDDGGDAAESTGAGGESEPEPGAGADETGPEAGASAGDDEPPEELLSPEERVLRLLRERGGRMKQAEVTEELDWSAARTSQVVGDLRDAGDVESFRLGRENVLRIPEDDDDEPSGG